MSNPLDPLISPNPIAPPTPNAPRDLFATEVSAALDEARGIIAEVGLRTYRVFIVTDKYDGQRRKEGNLLEREIDEISPPPEVRFISAAKVASSGGLLRVGDVLLSQITRQRRSTELRGRTLASDSLPKNWHFRIALQVRGEVDAEFYQPASEPVLFPTYWEMMIRPENQRGPLIITED